MLSSHEQFHPASSGGFVPSSRHEGIVVGDHKGIVVLWPDGHRSRFSWSLLRSVCPCADCSAAEDNALISERQAA